VADLDEVDIKCLKIILEDWMSDREYNLREGMLTGEEYLRCIKLGNELAAKLTPSIAAGF
jgi:hypothetical protein